MDEQVEQLNIQIAFTSALLFAISLNIYSTFGYKDILLNGKKSKFSKMQIYKIGVFSASITLIVTIYFIYLHFAKF